MFILFQAMIGFVIPLLIIGLSYYCVVNSVHKAQLQLNPLVRSQEFEAQLNRRVMIFVAVCKFNTMARWGDQHILSLFLLVSILFYSYALQFYFI